MSKIVRPTRPVNCSHKLYEKCNQLAFLKQTHNQLRNIYRNLDKLQDIGFDVGDVNSHIEKTVDTISESYQYSFVALVHQEVPDLITRPINNEHDRRELMRDFAALGKLAKL